MTNDSVPPALVPLLGRTFTMFVPCWSTGYPGIFRYRASLTLSDVAGVMVADIRATFELERTGEESERVETPATYTGVGRDGTLRLMLKHEMPWGPKAIKIDPAAGAFDTAGVISTFGESRTVAVLVGDYAGFDAAALDCLRAICQNWEPGFKIPATRAIRTDVPLKPGQSSRAGFIEGDRDRYVATDFWHSQETQLDGTVKQCAVREFVVRGLRPPADLRVTLVQLRKGDAPWSSSVSLGDSHDLDYVPEAVQIFDRYFPRPA
ncbi:unnamed protein product [Gemmata massiliana]|uniref:Uncharacterized protein n=1 Tax=Gemmata massiliana TaxID=1210884 RepID=A0A6P2CWZ0_9BACT|nr:hypothetical protein [Gemmata massiliana]VTR93511.1 unnamed protein product [Gemmata massiliana]